MENPTKKLLEETKVVDAETVNTTTEKKKQASSKSYTLKATFANFDRLREMDLIEEEDLTKVKMIIEKAMQKWIKNGMK